MMNQALKTPPEIAEWSPTIPTGLIQTQPYRLEGSWEFYPKVTIFGPPGSGKTSLAATAPRPFFMNCEPEGVLSIAYSGHLWWNIRSINDLRSCWDWMATHPEDFDTIVVDTLTNLQILGMDDFVEPTQLTLSKNLWGQSFRQMRSVITGLCAFPHHNVVFVCTDRLRDDEVTHLKVLMPDVPPSQIKLLNLNCRLFGHLNIHRQQNEETGETVPNRWLQTVSDGRVACKDTSNRLADYIYIPPPTTPPSPTLTDILNTMTGLESVKSIESGGDDKTSDS